MPTMISNKFSAILGERLLKISKVAEDTGISRTTLTNLYYRKTKCINFETLDKLCGYLGCTIEDILEYHPDEIHEERNECHASYQIHTES